jgi:hypothetical protein
MDFGFPHSRLGIAVRWGELGQQLELLTVRPQQLAEVIGEDPVQLLIQLDDLDLGLQVDLVIQAGGKTVARRLAVLGHQDDRRLQRGQHGKNEVEEDIGVGIEWFDLPCSDDAVESGPGDQRGKTQGYERPGPTKRGDAIGQAIAKGLLFRKGTVDVPADLFAWRRR